MIAVQGEALPFGVHYTEDGLSLTGLTVTVDIYRLAKADGAVTQIVSDGACTEVGDGLYKYFLAGASNNADGSLWAVFYTADTDADAQNIPAAWVVGYGDLNSIADILADLVVVQADLDNPDQYKADVSTLALQTTVLSIYSLLKQYSTLKKYIKSNQIEIKRSSDVEFDLYNLGDLTGRTSLYFTVKYMKDKDEATDAQSVLQIEETGGLLYINQAAGTPANGSLTVLDAAAGNIRINLDAEESDKIPPNEAYLYDVKKDNDIMGEGKFLVGTAITRTIT